MATLAERYWRELRPSAAAAREVLESPVEQQRRRPRRRVGRERELLRRAR
jgi:hypothetical protein